MHFLNSIIIKFTSFFERCHAFIYLGNAIDKFLSQLNSKSSFRIF